MKIKRLKGILFEIVLSIACINTLPVNAEGPWAERMQIDGIWYEVASYHDAWIVMDPGDPGKPRFPEGYDLTIPPMIEYDGASYPVVKIDDHAFLSQPIATISIPSTVRTISKLGLQELYQLQSISVDSENTDFMVIDGVLYDTEEEKTLLLYPSLKPGTSFDIPEGVVRLGYGSLQSQNLTHVNFPSTLRGIGDWALAGSKLDEIDLNEGLEAIGEYAFHGVTYHKPLVIPESVKDLSDYCFGGTEIENIVLPSWVVEIGVGWFKNSFTETIPVPERITRIGEYAFADSWIKHMDLPDGIHSIEFCAFASCDSLREIRLPLELSTLEDGIFFDCENLKRVTLNKNLKRVKAAFDDCPSLSDLYLLPERPPRLDEECPLGYRDPEYFINRLGQITVHVLEGCGEAYRNSTWAKVGPIVEDLTDGVDDLPADGAISSTATCTAYTLQGTVVAESMPYGELREALSPGIYIIRTASGKTEKIRL